MELWSPTINSPVIKPKGEPVVTFVGICYQQIPILAYSLLAQNYPNWRLFLYHDGALSGQDPDPITGNLLPHDWRIHYAIRVSNSGNRWGHPLRQEALQDIKEGKLFPETTHVVVTNADNYYVPGFCEKMLVPFENDPMTLGTYSECMGHNYQQWRLIETQFMLGHCDPCAFMFRKAVACRFGWPGNEETSDWEYIKKLHKHYGYRLRKIEGCLVIHN